MGTNELYECKQIKHVKQIVCFLEELWEHIEVVPVNIMLVDTRHSPSITLELDSLVPLKGLLTPSTIAENGPFDIWIYRAKFTKDSLNEHGVDVSFHCYKPTIKESKPFNDLDL